MATIESVILDVADTTAAHRFHTAAFALDAQIRLRASEAPTTGFRGFTPALTVSQPSTVDSLVATALDAGATTLEPAASKSLWGYGGDAPEGTGSHRLTIGGDAGALTDPDGFAWEVSSEHTASA